MRKVFLENLPTKEGIGANKNKLVIDWIKSEGYIVKFIYEDIEGKILIKQYKSKKLLIVYNKKEFIISLESFKRGDLKNIINYHKMNYKYEIGIRFQDDKRDLIIIDRKIIKNNNGQWINYYNYKCNLCGFDGGHHWSIKDKKYKDKFWVREDHVVNTSCSCCSNQPKIVVEGINDIPTTTPWMVKYFQGGIEEAKLFTYNSGFKIHPICQECGKVKEKEMPIYNIYKTKSIGCSCSDSVSYPNKFAIELLNQLNVEFETEYSPDWIGQKRYDFYIPSINLIVEMDGGFHSDDNTLNKKISKNPKIIDDYKDNQAKLYDIKVIRIDCDYKDITKRFEFIKKNVLDSELKSIFDLSIIDWNKINEYSLINLVKLACDYWNGGIKSTSKIGELLNLNQTTICRYLKYSANFNLCDYDEKESRNKGLEIGRLICRKPVEIFKDGISLGIFESAVDIERRSEELFGTKLYHSNISIVCNTESKRHAESYKGYVFKYANYDKK